jgi:hypothetical protein
MHPNLSPYHPHIVPSYDHITPVLFHCCTCSQIPVCPHGHSCHVTLLSYCRHAVVIPYCCIFVTLAGTVAIPIPGADIHVVLRLLQAALDRHEGKHTVYVTEYLHAYRCVCVCVCACVCMYMCVCA